MKGKRKGQATSYMEHDTTKTYIERCAYVCVYKVHRDVNLRAGEQNCETPKVLCVPKSYETFIIAT